jgi:histidine ammonia-lyase
MTDPKIPAPEPVALPKPDGTAVVNEVNHPTGQITWNTADAWSLPLVEAYAAAREAAAHKQWAAAAEAMAQEAERKFPGDGTVAHWLRSLVAKRAG